MPKIEHPSRTTIFDTWHFDIPFCLILKGNMLNFWCLLVRIVYATSDADSTLNTVAVVKCLWFACSVDASAEATQSPRLGRFVNHGNTNRVRSSHEYIAYREGQIGRYRDVGKQLGKAARRQKKYYDMRTRRQEFKREDWVWYFRSRRRIGRSPKWQKWYTGPFMVIKQTGPVKYRLQRTKHTLSSQITV